MAHGGENMGTLFPGWPVTSSSPLGLLQCLHPSLLIGIPLSYPQHTPRSCPAASAKPGGVSPLPPSSSTMTRLQIPAFWHQLEAIGIPAMHGSVTLSGVTALLHSFPCNQAPPPAPSLRVTRLRMYDGTTHAITMHAFTTRSLPHILLPRIYF